MPVRMGGRADPVNRGDEHKEKRVSYVEWLYPVWAGRFGPKTKAGNVADAVLLARWAVSHGPRSQPANPDYGGEK